MVHMVFRVGDHNDLFIDCAPSGTYHINDLDIVADTLYDLVNAGLIEKK